MKNVEIAEGGIGRRLSGTKFVLTDKPNSDQMEVWVDEDDRKLARLYATSNGTYYPEDYDAYGFSSVTVSIHGGVANPDLPNIEMPDGTIVPALIPEIEMPDGTVLPIDELFPEIPLDDVKVPDTVGEEGSSIVGIDPEDGYTYKVDVDDNGNLDIEKVPTDIRITQAPDTEYTFGQDFDPDDFRVELVDKDGNVVKTKEYPDGTVPAEDANLTLPDKAPDRDEVRRKGTWTAKGYLDLSGVSVTATSGKFIVEMYKDDFRTIDAGYPVVMGHSSASYHNQIEGLLFSPDRGGGLGHSFTANGLTVYYNEWSWGVIGGGIYSISPKISDRDTHGPAGAWVAAYGAMAISEDLTAQWESPYSGYVLEDGKKVTISDPGYGDL